MDIRTFGSVFFAILIAELGDKTQLATLSFAAAGRSKLIVFLGASTALVLTSLMGVYFGDLVARAIPANYVKIGAGFLFITMGVLFLLNKL